MKAEQRQYIYDALLFLAAVVLYAPSLRNGFVGDDLIYFIGNRYIDSFDISTILRFGAIGADYLPLRDLSFAFDHLLWGRNPLGFHLTNIILFGFTVIAVKHLFVRLNVLLTGAEGGEAETPAFLAALIFAFHPNHREVVYAVFNRGALLTVLFSVLCCLFFLRFLRGGAGRYFSFAAAFVCYLAALMSREYSIVIPMALVLIILFDDRAKWETHLIHTIPFFLTAAIFYGIYKEYAVSGGFIMPSSGSFFAENVGRAAVAAKIMLFYLVRTATSLGDFRFDGTLPLALVSIAVVAGSLFAAYLMRRTRPQLLFGMLFYLICLIPVLNFFGTLPIVSPRYSFLPCVGLFFAVTSLPHAGMKKLIPTACVVLTLCWTLLTMQKTSYWKDNVTFWEAMAARDQTGYTYLQLGYAYYDAHEYGRALEALRKAMPPPQDQRYYAAVGRACLRLTDYRCAVTFLETALSFGGDDASLSRDLAGAQRALEHPDDAIEFPGMEKNSRKNQPSYPGD